MVKNIVFKDVKSVLETANVCRRCILRFFGEKEYTSYISKINIEKTINRFIDMQLDEVIPDSKNFDDDDKHPPKRFLSSPCAACLGILQDLCDEMVSKVDEAVNQNKHIFQDFVLQVSLPVIVDLRDRLFFLYLKEKLGDNYLSEESGIPSVKDVVKWVVGPQFGKRTGSDFIPFSDFQITLLMTYPDIIKECSVLYESCPQAFPNARKAKVKRENIYNKTSVLKAMELLSSEIKKLYTLPPSAPDTFSIQSEIQCSHSPLYLGGRYNKYSRELSQTPWLLDGERKMESSVNELITDVVQKRILADKIIFSASGREDVDVRMLGNGRPFILELINPRCLKWTEEEIKAIENEINESTEVIVVKNLQVITKQDTLLLKEGEEQKRKSYYALCLVQKTLCQDDVTKLENLKDLTLHQKTPIRVLHRRTLSTRERLIHSMKAEIISAHRLGLKLETQAGTYVKEFVHGDFGRTAPNLGTLLNTETDILELDVECVHLDWPPK